MIQDFNLYEFLIEFLTHQGIILMLISYNFYNNLTINLPYLHTNKAK